MNGRTRDSVVAGVLALALSVLAAGVARAAPGASPDGFFQDADASRIAAHGPRLTVPRASRTVALDLPALVRHLAGAPMEGTGHEGVPIWLPMPDGSYQRFRVTESPIMAPELAARYPGIRTYAARGVDDPGATARLDVTPAGFHGFVLGSDSEVYIDPYQRGDLATYISYRRRDYERKTGASVPFRCGFDEARRPISRTAPRPGATSPTPDLSNGPTRRVYRLALAATGEYTQFAGGTKELALAAMTTTMNRVNGIYLREIAVQLNIVANDDALIYLDGATDPYTNDNGDTMLGENQTNVDAVIGSANYDIGHVFSTGGGGVAQLRVPCDATMKAMGVTGSSSPTGDAFDVDYVAHEMGHQFGANHSFNGTTDSCVNRNASTAYEPGSGTTIMGYAGVCGAENVQPHTDALFHAVSFDEILDFLAADPGGATCAATFATGNQPPAVSAGASYTIPAGTPFVLTASGSDPDGNALSYCWQEFDLGAAAPPNTDNGDRPIFRTFLPSASPSRTFPRLSDVLAGTTTLGEAPITTSRTMTFRVTARDNVATGGGVNNATTTVTSTTSAGPFLVTAPQAGATWAGGSSQQVTWNVAGTDAAPVSCANVKISFSSDGGATFATVLAASAPNTGSHPVTAPLAGTTTARIQVSCVGNVFFDVSHGDFTVTAASLPPGDVNADGKVDVLDVFYLINYLFANGLAPVGCGDVNASGKVDVQDVFYLINGLFAGGPAPKPCA